MNHQPSVNANLITAGFLLLIPLVFGMPWSVQAGDPAFLASPDFVGSEQCADCHPEQTRLWQGSHHDWAMKPATSATVKGDFNKREFDYSGERYYFFIRDQRYFVNTPGPDGKARDYELVFTFGIDPLQQYLLRFPGGRLQALTVAWDNRPLEQGGQRWFHLYPDGKAVVGDVLHWSNSSQTWNTRCADCHSTNLQKNYRSDSQTFDTTWSEDNVACEACHGAAAGHMSWLEEGQPATSPDKGFLFRLDNWSLWAFKETNVIASLMTPKKSVRIDVCASCHSRRIRIDSATHRGKFLDSHTPRLLDYDLYYADGQIQDEVYVYASFLQSKMYQQGVVCSNCHDPHSLKLKFSGNALCTQCHQSDTFDVSSHHHHGENSAGAQCANCHMPERTYMQIDPRRDHSFKIPRPDLSEALATPNACSNCHAEKPITWVTQQFRQWGIEADKSRDFATAFNEISQASPLAVPGIASIVDDNQTPAIIRASALSRLQQMPNRAAMETAISQLRSPEGLLRLAAVQVLANLPPQYRYPVLSPLLRDPLKSVRLEATRVLGTVATDQLDEQQRAGLQVAIDEYLAVQALNADFETVQLNLGNFHMQRGDMVNAREAYKMALQINPWFIPAMINLSDLDRQRGDLSASQGWLQRGLKMAPDEATLLHAWGLMLVRQKKYQSAMDYLQRAADNAPDNIRFRYIYAVALNSTGDPVRAQNELLKAYRQNRYNRDVLFHADAIVD